LLEPSLLLRAGYEDIMKYLEFLSPKGKGVYPQEVILSGSAGGKELGRTWGATAPNPQIPGTPDRPNMSEYPIVYPGTYLGVFHADRHHGRPCISLNDDGPVWILQDKNPRTGAEHSAVGIRVHTGYKWSWRGSAGCMTLEPPPEGELYLDRFGDNWLLTHFEQGEQVAVFIPDQEWFANS
jgi:hypothetical protein